MDLLKLNSSSTYKPVRECPKVGPLLRIGGHEAGHILAQGLIPGPHRLSAPDMSQRQCPEDPDWDVASTASPVLT